MVVAVVVVIDVWLFEHDEDYTYHYYYLEVLSLGKSTNFHYFTSAKNLQFNLHLHLFATFLMKRSNYFSLLILSYKFTSSPLYLHFVMIFVSFKNIYWLHADVTATAAANWILLA